MIPLLDMDVKDYIVIKKITKRQNRINKIKLLILFSILFAGDSYILIQIINFLFNKS